MTAVVRFGVSVDDDLRHVFVLHPKGRVDALRRPGDIPVELHADYGSGPYRFRPVRQNGSRVHLRLLAADGRDARYPDGHHLAGRFVERTVYSSALRRGVYWEAEVAV